MPQLDFTFYFSQLFWLSVFFYLLFCFIRYFFIPRIESILKRRADFTQLLKVDLESIKHEIEEKRKKSNAIIQDAKLAAKGIINEANSVAEKIRADAIHEISRKAQVVYAKNNLLLKDFKKNAKDELTRIVFDVATRYYKEIPLMNNIGKPVDFGEIRNLIKHEIEDYIRN